MDLTEEERKERVNTLRNEVKQDDISEDKLVQFLEANVWNVDDAKHQLIETIKWRKKMDVEHIPVATKYNNLPLLMAVRGYKYIDDGNCHVEPELSDSVIRIANCIGGDCFHKFDKEGHPILIDRTGFHNTKEMGNHVTTDEMTNYQISANEFLNRVIMPEGGEIAGKPVHSETLIFDCTNMSLWQLHMSAFYHLKAIAEIVQQYYPETLHRLFIVNAPSAFVVMFKIIKPVLNPRTLDKIHVLGKDYKSVLLDYIDADSLPSFLGGNCKCEHMPGGCVPSVAQKTVKRLVAQQNEKVTTVYNSKMMKAAKTDESLCKLIVP
ncbi:CRAL/TRIO domain-containing protein [Backusella circina FSU 941]|nr:CRAL/TRIO domain-containing protein [Backusella circina FSU 941]